MHKCLMISKIAGTFLSFIDINIEKKILVCCLDNKPKEHQVGSYILKSCYAIQSYFKRDSTLEEH